MFRVGMFRQMGRYIIYALPLIQLLRFKNYNFLLMI